MSVSPTFASLPLNDPQPDPGNARADRVPAQTFPASGSEAAGDDSQTQSGSNPASRGQDEVRLQWQAPGETPVYQFVNQQGTLILQVPSEQELNLSREISQELAQEEAAKMQPAEDGGKENGR